MRLAPLRYYLLISLGLMISKAVFPQDKPWVQFDFNGTLKSGMHSLKGDSYEFVEGIDRQALSLKPGDGYHHAELAGLSLDGNGDFTIQCWIQTSSQNPTVFLSKKAFHNKGISEQQNAGWVLYSSDGTLAWSIGSGDRRINYERDNGEKMPINDGVWHQLTMTYNKVASSFRLYYDGKHVAVYKVNFDFGNDEPLVIGAIEPPAQNRKYERDIELGQEQLQLYVDAFNRLGLEPLKNEEFIDLIVDPEGLFAKKLEKQDKFPRSTKLDLSKALEIRKYFRSNPYTVYQNRALTNLKPVSKVYTLQAGRVVINEPLASQFTQSEKLFPSGFAMDDLCVWERTLSQEEIWKSYRKYKKVKAPKLPKKQKAITVGVWNIWHGGIHWSLEKDGWDSRKRIVELIQAKNIDVVLMQETYSNGDFIAAELGYYFATTSDWDYCYQGANISVISRFPIKDIHVSTDTEFNNVAVKLAISKSQEIWAMSNWYGMGQFPDVFGFHEGRFAESSKVPVLFGGDFNAVPHTDGGESPASATLLEAGFTDAFRSLYPDAKKFPGITHRNGKRIDQLYFKGKGLHLKATEVIATWPGGFPSDHHLIVSKFEFD